MQKGKSMAFLDVAEKLEEREVNEEKCKHLEREVEEKQGEWDL